MRNRILTLCWLAAGALLLSNSGCVIVSASHTSKTTPGSVWYVKRGPIGNDKVYYCPSDQDAACYQATIQK